MAVFLLLNFLFFVCLFVCSLVVVYLFICLFVYLLVYLLTYLLTYLFIHFIRSFIHPSIHTFISFITPIKFYVACIIVVNEPRYIACMLSSLFFFASDVVFRLHFSVCMYLSFSVCCCLVANKDYYLH